MLFAAYVGAFWASIAALVGLAHSLPRLLGNTMPAVTRISPRWASFRPVDAPETAVWPALRVGHRVAAPAAP